MGGMSVENRGHNFQILNETITTVGREFTPSAKTSKLQIYNIGGNIVEFYGDRADFTADMNFVSIPAATAPAVTQNPPFAGPFEVGGGVTQENPKYFLRSRTGDSAVQIVEFYRRS